MAGRKPRPTAIKILEGEKNRDRINLDEPKPKVGRPTCPDHLSDVARDEWQRIVPELEVLGLLTQIDRSALAAYCQAYGRWVEAERVVKQKGVLYKTEKGNVITSPMLWVANKAMEQMHKYLVEFGMTPSARSRVVSTATDNKDVFDKLLDECVESEKRDA